VLADLPVGENLQDAIAAGPLNFLTDSSVADPLVTVDSVLSVNNVQSYAQQGGTTLSVPGGILGLAFINTKFENSSIDWPDVQLQFSSGNFATDRNFISYHRAYYLSTSDNFFIL